jgi:hypothetical protein
MLNILPPNSVKIYTHIQKTPATTWVCYHNLQKDCVNCDVILSDGYSVIPFELIHVDNNTLYIEFNEPRSGRAQIV